MTCLDTITSILRHTRPLLGSDVPWISSNITNLKSQLLDLDNLAMSSPATTIDDDSRDTIQRHLEMHKSALAPIGRLPPDVLLEIFWFCMPDPNEDATHTSCDARGLRWVLSHVCSFWRHIVLTCPSLWSTVVIQPPFGKHAVPTLERHLHLSGTLPLHVAVMLSGSDTTYDVSIRRLISKHSRRWRLLDMRMPKIRVETIFSEIGRGALPLLEEVSLECDVSPLLESGLQLDPVQATLVVLLGHGPKHTHRTWFLDSPLLRRVCLLVCPGSGISMHPNVTHYSAIHFHSDGLESILERDQLVELNMIDLDPIHLSIPPITHQNIQNLRTPAVSLENLDMPQLVELTIDDEDLTPMLDSPIATAHTDYLIAFLDRSQCKLRNLHIYDLSITTDKRLLTDVLPSLAVTIRSVGLSIHPIDAQDLVVEMFTRFTRTATSVGLVPNLEALDLSLPESETVVLTPQAKDAIFDMVKSRRNNEWAKVWKAPLLKEFRFDSDNKTYMAELREFCLNDLEKGGLRILKPTRSSWLLWQGPWLDRENWV
ncbi:hypothetical protein BDZ89DRAFT_1158017 [Hymenopellis radicata]|nr:hypothetical protein BDZ89DRAFT_1158017 [Hymenopellis radicata]